mmetsp:Transcript_13205/g.27635  ORF Transcript_13205/g.27635 Transcript_13205/m.27635 type:complete len:105 (-) Transcript_13205:455-769(-)
MVDASAVEETFTRLLAQPGTIGALVINDHGIAIKSTFENDVAVQYAALVSHFTNKARSVVRRMDSDNDLKHLRIRSKKHEIVIAPEFSHGAEYYLVVVQAPRPM